MTYHFHDWGRFMDRIAEMKSRNPEIGAEYDELREEIDRLEGEARTLFPFSKINKDIDLYLESRKFRDEKIAPLENRQSVLWDQLFCKHRRHHYEGRGVHLECGEPVDSIREICDDCGADISHYRRPVRIRKSDKLPV